MINSDQIVNQGVGGGGGTPYNVHDRHSLPVRAPFLPSTLHMQELFNSSGQDLINLIIFISIILNKF